MESRLLLKREELLGEGILCLPDADLIAWVDILRKKLILSDSNGDNIRVLKQPSEIGAVLPSVTDDLILVLRNSVISFNPLSFSNREIWSAAEVEPRTNRFNDATVDRLGNLWVGSMDFDAKSPSGILYRITPEGEANVMETGFRCINGPAFSINGKTIYVGDTMNGQVLAFDHDPVCGSLTNKRVHIDFGIFDGLPDGMTVDAQDNLWVCQITAGRISCFNSSGIKVRSIALPVPMVTSCCFGGPELTSLYATTARIILDTPDLNAFPDSGSIYLIESAGKGLKPNKFGKNAS
ncbi:SMP-30/gluconolactonase/LRE family protein [Paracoccaceae bacterium]|nr:SMP-30/gluconolactonase/LRE family protein [Paracoccaceae bacterium]